MSSGENLGCLVAVGEIILMISAAPAVPEHDTESWAVSGCPSDSYSEKVLTQTRKQAAP